MFRHSVTEPAFGLAHIAKVGVLLAGYLVNYILCDAVDGCSYFPGFSCPVTFVVIGRYANQAIPTGTMAGSIAVF